MKRAFTLIELLVVIAIIAILAAILFPVFAQAKDSAKKTASLSNVKEHDMGAIMYNGDNDDMAVVGCDYTWSAWTDKIQPYVKNWYLIFSPAGGPHMMSSWQQPQYDWWANWRWFSQYGYNAVYMNRANGDCSNMGLNNAMFGPPISMTSPQDPANTIIFAEVARDAPDDNVGAGFVYPPGTWTDDSSCVWTPGDDWGIVSASDNFTTTGNLGGTAQTTKMGLFRPTCRWRRGRFRRWPRQAYEAWRTCCRNGLEHHHVSSWQHPHP
jgi:prepilin-type N-terminal cleavage/methylation domain-containing protein